MLVFVCGLAVRLETIGNVLRREAKARQNLHAALLVTCKIAPQHDKVQLA